MLSLANATLTPESTEVLAGMIAEGFYFSLKVTAHNGDVESGNAMFWRPEWQDGLGRFPSSEWRDVLNAYTGDFGSRDLNELVSRAAESARSLVVDLPTPECYLKLPANWGR